MKHLILAATLVTTTTRFAAAQTKTLTGEMKTATAIVEAINQRHAKSRSGKTTPSLTHGQGSCRQQAVRHHQGWQQGHRALLDNVVIRVKHPAKGRGHGHRRGDAGLQRQGGRPAATRRTITATITAIDMKIPLITFTGPNNWKYSSRVEDKNALAKVKVGDKVDIVWTEAVMISLEAPAK